ncbi:MAG: peptidase MA family metallohydrolase [Chloroflexota bacterium]|jgi:hypothetical protein
MSIWSLRLVRIWIFGFTLGLSFVFISPVVAQVEQTELRSTAEYSYGQSMRFNLDARNVGDVNKITLYFRLGTSPDSYAVKVPFAPGNEIEASYALDLTQTRLPPFGAITYWWELERADNSTLGAPAQVMNYVDDQFSWRQIRVIDELGGGSVRIHWTGEDESLGEQARTIALEMLPAIGRLLPLDYILPFDIYIYPSSADLSAALRLAGREYEVGQSYPDLGVVLVTVVNPRTADTELRQELSRGLVDLMLYQAVGQFASRVPAWLTTGLSRVVEGQADPLLINSLNAAVANGTTLPLPEFCVISTIDSDLAIAQSEALVAYIVEGYGEKSLRDLIIFFADGADCPSAFQTILSTSPEQMEPAYLLSIKQSSDQPSSMTILLWIGLIGAGFGLAALLVLRPGQQRSRRTKP